MEQKTKINEGKLILTALLLIFITLKLCKVIDWSWWVVLIPLWLRIFWWLAAIWILVGRRMKADEESKQKWDERIKQMQEKRRNDADR